MLASLPSNEAVTTNFDGLFESARTTDGRRLAILPENAVDAEGRWLLKLHGTVTRPDEMVLTRSDYLDMPRRYGALMGLVQGLLMMRHMMFVGYSLRDEDFMNSFMKFVQRGAKSLILASWEPSSPFTTTSWKRGLWRRFFTSSR